MIKAMNVSRQLKWTLQGIFVAFILCHRNIEIQYDKRVQGQGICKVESVCSRAWFNFTGGGKNCTDSCTNGHGNGEGTIEFGGNILVHASSVMTWDLGKR